MSWLKPESDTSQVENAMGGSCPLAELWFWRCWNLRPYYHILNKRFAFECTFHKLTRFQEYNGQASPWSAKSLLNPIRCILHFTVPLFYGGRRLFGCAVNVVQSTPTDLLLRGCAGQFADSCVRVWGVWRGDTNEHRNIGLLYATCTKWTTTYKRAQPN